MDPTAEKTIAVLIACYNRCAVTLRCLETLRKQQLPAGYQLRIYLTDDGSTDGTGEAVRASYPEATILKGDGNLYWAGAMRVAWEAARPADFYLWLNDDVALEEDAVGRLLATHEISGRDDTIVAGATRDPDCGGTCTGGIRRHSWYRCEVIDPTDRPQPCDSISGNVVLVPRKADELIGGLDPAYRHYFADGDYGIRARRQGVEILLAPGHVGWLKLNPIANSSFDPRLPVRERWRKMTAVNGYRPPREWWAFVKAHAPRPKAFYWAAPYVLFALESVLGGKVRLRRDVKVPVKMT